MATEKAADTGETSSGTSRRNFLKASAGVMGAVGVLALPPGLSHVLTAVSPGVNRLTQSYPQLKIARTAELVDGQPVDFQYPLQEHNNLLVKLATPATLGVGPGGDIVAFSYLCSHMGCPLNGSYKHEYRMLGPCPCHFSRFDLSKGGINILGQATQSLPQIVLEARAGDVYATGVTGLIYGYWNNLTGGTPLDAGA